MDNKILSKAFKRIVSEDWEKFELVPEELKDDEMLIYAVLNNKEALKYASEEKRATIITEAVKKGPPFINHSIFLKNIPKDLINSEICLELVKNEHRFFNGVPQEMITSEICNEAIKQIGNYLGNVPNELKTQEMCKKAVMNGCTLEYVPDDMKTTEICLIAVKNNTERYRKFEY